MFQELYSNECLTNTSLLKAILNVTNKDGCRDCTLYVADEDYDQVMGNLQKNNLDELIWVDSFPWLKKGAWGVVTATGCIWSGGTRKAKSDEIEGS